MPKRKRSCKTKHTKERSALPSPIQALSQAELVKLIEIKSNTKEMEEKSRQTDEDTQICKKIKLRLCEYFSIPNGHYGELCTHIFNLFPAPHQDLGLSSEYEVSAFVSSLQSKFGFGSLVRVALSPKHLFDAELNIPQPFQYVLPKECLFDKITFVPDNILRLLGVTCTPYDKQKQYPYIAIIYDSPQNMVNFVYYETVCFFRGKQFKQFLQKEKWNSNTLKNKFPEFAQHFKSENMIQLIMLCQHGLEVKGLTSLRLFANVWIPESLASFVEDKKQKHGIENIIKHLYKQCDNEANEAKFQWLRRSKQFIAVLPKDRMCFMVCQFSFIREALFKSIPQIIGMDMFVDISRSILIKTPSYLSVKKTIALTERIEGRNCYYCNRKEIRSDEFNEQFKKCKRCQNVLYCSVKCQKRDWNTTHRHNCKKVTLSL